MKHSTAYKLMTGSLILFIILSCSKPVIVSEKILLEKNWWVQQSGKINTPADSDVSIGFIDTSLWYAASVPSTVMGVLTANGLYNDLFVGDSLKRINEKQFEESWWFRTEFTLPDIQVNQHVMLNFDGISYYANVWLNSILIASRDSVYGTFRRFEFDITPFIKDSANILAVEVFKQKPGDFGHGFVDWNPAPPDDNMGLWRDVYLKITGDVAVKNVFVKSDVNTETLDEAALTITVDLVNYSKHAVDGKLTGKSEDFEFSIPVNLGSGATKHVTITPADVKSLKVNDPKLWWCNNLGEPNLYNLNLQFEANKAISDAQDITFGIREIDTYTNSEGHKGFRLNGKEVLIKGGGWTDELFLRNTKESNEIQVQYVKHMNLNTIRFENIWGTNRNIYDLCDKYGILAMVGWSCQWEWDNYLGKSCDKFGGIKTNEDMDLIVESLRHQIRYLQNHPSIFVWMLGSDMLPRPALEKKYCDLIKTIDDRPYLAAASKRTSEISGPTGVKMNGPYNYVGPSYWYIDSVNGGAYGFNTETGPGPQIPVMESFVKMIPEDKRWPVNEIWNYHCNPSKSFGNLDIFNNALFQRYGRPMDLSNYMLKSDVQSYEAMKGMFESFRANRPNTTGIIQWMLNSAWPSFYWQLYDYYMLPTAAYYAARKANAPLQLIYNYGNQRIYSVNETFNRYNKAKAKIRLLDIQGNEILSDELAINLEANSSEGIFNLPPVNGVAFLALSLLNEQNVTVADNFYWLSGKPDIYDWAKTEWYYTPIISTADYRPLNYLAHAEIGLVQKCIEQDDSHVIEITLTNKSDGIAFFINLTLKNDNGQTVFPVFWDDNYLSILPGEMRVICCTIPGDRVTDKNYSLTLSGWNVNEQLIKISL
jgi:exo-1,4-beta-D-glucosaminidase